MAKSSLTAQLASQILDHIRTNDLPRGQHLPSQALADACRVSRAPINSAFKFLQNLGVVRFESNRGYFLAADAKELAALKLIANEAGDGERVDAALPAAPRPPGEDSQQDRPGRLGRAAPWARLGVPSHPHRSQE